MSVSKVDDGSDSIFRPKPGDVNLFIPQTFGFKGGRVATKSTKNIFAVLGILFALLTVVITPFNSEDGLLLGIVKGLVYGYIIIFLVRMFLLDERAKRKVIEAQVEKDFKVPVKEIFNIYHVSKNGFCYFTSGHIGLFVVMHKAPIVGTGDVDKFNHFNAIGDAYNIYHTKRNSSLVQIDLMDFIGEDRRLTKSWEYYRTHKETPVAVEDMRGIISNLVHESNSVFSTHDIYMYRSANTNPEMFTAELEEMLRCLLTDSGYSDFSVMNEKRVSDLFKALFGLKSFSFRESVREAYTPKGNQGIKHLSSVVDGERIVYGISAEDKKEQDKRKREREAYRKAQKKQRKKSGTGDSTDLLAVYDLDADSELTEPPAPVSQSVSSAPDLTGEVAERSEVAVPKSVLAGKINEELGVIPQSERSASGLSGGKRSSSISWDSF